MTRYSSTGRNAPKDEAKVAALTAIEIAGRKATRDRENRKALLELFGDNRSAIAKSLYEDSRMRVSGRPPWDDLDPDDLYDVGMRDHALAKADQLIASMVRGKG